MSQTALTIHEAADRLGVCASTLRTWGEKTGVAGTRTRSGKRLYTTDDVAALEAVKDLRDQDAGWLTIRRHIGKPELETTLTSTPLMAEPEMLASAPDSATSDTMVTKVLEMLNAQTGLAERYARAGYQIGRLEGEVRHLTDERTRLASKLTQAEQKLGELTLNEELNRNERARLGRELNEVRQRLAAAELNPPGRFGAVATFFKKYW